jgi:hypothetical protein
MLPSSNRHHRSLPGRSVARHSPRTVRPAAAYRQRGSRDLAKSAFSAPETWHDEQGTGELKVIVQSAGAGYWHPATPQMIRDRIAQLPKRFAEAVNLVQLSGMNRKRRLFPCYGMQWGENVYLYPMEASLVETYVRPPTPQQQVEAKMFGAVWSQYANEWRLTWTEQAVQDFYLNNVLIHEIGHVLDERNTNTEARERYAIWFATEYGYRASRGRR